VQWATPNASAGHKSDAEIPTDSSGWSGLAARMATKTTCDECGSELPANAPQGLCPRCLASMGMRLLPADPIPKSDIRIERTGTMIGRYKMLEKIGEGGFGVVFMAEQVEPVQRKVALQIIKAGMDTKEVHLSRCFSFPVTIPRFPV
jgi:hypothetical protein